MQIKIGELSYSTDVAFYDSQLETNYCWVRDVGCWMLDVVRL